jgi:hypothetical protein
MGGEHLLVVVGEEFEKLHSLTHSLTHLVCFDRFWFVLSGSDHEVCVCVCVCLLELGF